jgi:hypothetical protein
VDGAARQGARQTQTDENHHLAKVRVAGSNPVFRSIVAGQEKARRSTAPGTEPPRSPRPTGHDGPGRTPAGPQSRGAAPHPRSGEEGAHGGGEAGLLGAWKSFSPYPLTNPL